MWIETAVAIVCLAGIGWYLDRLKIRKIEEGLVDRKSLSSEEFGTFFFPESRERAAIAAKAHRLLAASIPVDISKIHPDDDLLKLKIFSMDSLSDVSFIMRMETEFGLKFVDSELAPLQTIRAIVLYIEDKLLSNSKEKAVHPDTNL